MHVPIYSRVPPLQVEFLGQGSAGEADTEGGSRGRRKGGGALWPLHDIAITQRAPFYLV